MQQVDWNTFNTNWGGMLRNAYDASNTDYAAQEAAIAQRKLDWTASNPATYDHDGGWTTPQNPWDQYSGGQRDGDAMAGNPWAAVKKASGWSGDNGQTGNAFTDLQGNAIAKTGGESGMDYLGLDANGNELYSSAGDNGQGQRSWQQWIHNKGSNTLDAVGAPSLSKYDPAAMGRHALTNLAIVGTAGLAGGALLGGEAAGLGGAVSAPVAGGSAVGTDLGLLGGGMDSLDALLASNGAFGTAAGEVGAGLGGANSAQEAFRLSEIAAQNGGAGALSPWDMLKNVGSSVQNSGLSSLLKALLPNGGTGAGGTGGGVNNLLQSLLMNQGSKESAAYAQQHAQELRDLGAVARKGSSPWDTSGGRGLADEQLKKIISGDVTGDMGYDLAQKSAARVNSTMPGGMSTQAAANAAMKYQNDRIGALSSAAGTQFDPLAGYNSEITANIAANALGGQGLATKEFGANTQNNAIGNSASSFVDWLLKNNVGGAAAAVTNPNSDTNPFANLADSFTSFAKNMFA